MARHKAGRHVAGEDDQTEKLTDIMRRTGAQTVNDLAGRIYMAPKPLWGMQSVFPVRRPGVPGLLVAFEKREYEGKRTQCAVIEWLDGEQYWLPVDSLFKGFVIVDAEEIVQTYITKEQLEEGFK